MPDQHNHYSDDYHDDDDDDHDDDHDHVIDKSLDLEKSREEMTPYFLARSRKLDFHFSFYS